MKFGYVLENFDKNLSPENLIETAQMAEDYGFHSIWATDHIMLPRENPRPQYNNITEAIVTISFLAGHTQRLKLGISSLVLPQRNPILVAKQLASLDYLTKGRVMVAFAAGWAEKEFRFLNQDFKHRGQIFDEYLQIVKALWSGETSFRGTYFQFEDVAFKPLPFQKKIPIWIAGNSTHAFRRALKYGDGWHPVHIQPPTIKNFFISQFKESNALAEKHTFTVAVRRTIHSIREDFPMVVKMYEKVGVDYLVLAIPGPRKALKSIGELISSFTD